MHHPALPSIPSLPTLVRIGGEVSLITATITPAIGTIAPGDTIASAMSADYDQTANYDSSSSPTIASVVPAVTVNGVSALFTDTVDAGDVVVVTVTVTDGEGNVRPFNAGSQTVVVVTVATTGDAGEIIFDPIAPLDQWAATTGDAGEIILEEAA